MLFNLEIDTGATIVGYVVPDGYSASPSIAVRRAGEDVLTLVADDPRPALVAAGRHETGACGFHIDENMLPGLSKLEELEIYDIDSGLLVYRRPQSFRIKKRILRVETHLIPLRGLDQALAPRFQYSTQSIEKFGRETTTQLFLLNKVDSVYVSGKIFYKNYRNYIETNFQTTVILHNPYEEMAERLIVLGKTKTSDSNAVDIRDRISLQPLMEFADGFPIHDATALSRALRKMPVDVAHALANPVVRQLTTTAPDEAPGNRAVSSALDFLASCAVVGIRRDPESFISGLAQFVDASGSSLPTIKKIRGTTALAKMLKESRLVDNLLEKDLELYHHVSTAFRKLEA